MSRTLRRTLATAVALLIPFLAACDRQSLTGPLDPPVGSPSGPLIGAPLLDHLDDDEPGRSVRQIMFVGFAPCARDGEGDTFMISVEVRTTYNVTTTPNGTHVVRNERMDGTAFGQRSGRQYTVTGREQDTALLPPIPFEGKLVAHFTHHLTLVDAESGERILLDAVSQQVLTPTGEFVVDRMEMGATCR